MSVARAGPNRLGVTITSSGVIQSIRWFPGATFEIETDRRLAITGGVIELPVSTSSTHFVVHRLSGGAVTVPFTLTGSFGTWHTFVGGGPDAW